MMSDFQSYHQWNLKSISVKHYTLISLTLLIKLKFEEKKKHLKTYLNKCLHLCIWTAKFELWEVFAVVDLYIYLTSRWLKKRRIPFVLFAFAQYENNYEPPPPETDIDFRRREDHQSDLNIGLNVRIICLRIMLIGHRKDMKDCVYTNDFVLIYL